MPRHSEVGVAFMQVMAALYNMGACPQRSLPLAADYIPTRVKSASPILNARCFDMMLTISHSGFGKHEFCES